MPMLTPRVCVVSILALVLSTATGDPGRSVSETEEWRVSLELVDTSTRFLLVFRDVVEGMKLLKRGADVNVVGAPSGCGLAHLLCRSAPLEPLSASEVVTLMEQYCSVGLSLNSPDRENAMTPLMYELRYQRRKEVIEALLRLGANPTLRDRFGNLPESYVELDQQSVLYQTLRRARLRWEAIEKRAFQEHLDSRRRL